MWDTTQVLEKSGEYVIVQQMLKKSTHDVTINYISGITLIYFLISRSLTLVGCVGIYVCVYKEDQLYVY